MKDDDVDLVARALGIEAAERGPLSRRLAAVGGAVGLWRAGPEALGPGLSAAVEARWVAIEALWRHLHHRVLDRAPIDSPCALLERLDPFLPLAPVESLHAVFLDGRGRFGGTEEISRGCVDACLVHPREVFAPALRARAVAVAVVHNHPSGDPEPSGADRALTDRLSAAGRLLGIPLVDHLVVGRGGHCSLGPGVPQEGMASALTACDPVSRCGPQWAAWGSRSR